jgi:hypothetical protein
MRDLVEYILKHTERLPREATREGAIDLGFFKVALKGSPDAEEFRRLIAANAKGEFANVNPLDGEEHSYIELGGWIGDQGLAMQFMGLSEALGLSRTLSPRTMLGDAIGSAMEQQLLGMGMLTMVGNSPSKQQERADGKPWSDSLGDRTGRKKG